MNRKSAMGALHPVFFILTVYAISIVLAFFVCNVIYSSLHTTTSVTQKSVEKMDELAILK